MLNDLGKGHLQSVGRFAQTAPIMHRDVDRLGAKQQFVDQILRSPYVPKPTCGGLKQPRIPRLCKLVRQKRQGLSEFGFGQTLREHRSRFGGVDQRPFDGQRPSPAVAARTSTSGTCISRATACCDMCPLGSVAQNL